MAVDRPMDRIYFIAITTTVRPAVPETDRRRCRRRCAPASEGVSSQVCCSAAVSRESSSRTFAPPWRGDYAPLDRHFRFPFRFVPFAWTQFRTISDSLYDSSPAESRSRCDDASPHLARSAEGYRDYNHRSRSKEKKKRVLSALFSLFRVVRVARDSHEQSRSWWQLVSRGGVDQGSMKTEHWEGFVFLTWNKEVNQSRENFLRSSDVILNIMNILNSLKYDSCSIYKVYIKLEAFILKNM